MYKIGLSDFTSTGNQNDKREFPLQTVVNAPIALDNGKELDHFASCAAHCVAITITDLASQIGKYNGYISVNEQEKLQYACEGMCTNNLESTTYMMSVRFPSS